MKPDKYSNNEIEMTHLEKLKQVFAVKYSNAIEWVDGYKIGEIAGFVKNENSTFNEDLNELIKEAQREAFEAGSDIDYDVGIGEMQLEYPDFETWYKQQKK